MRWFNRKPRPDQPDDSDSGDQAAAVRELLDPYDGRASVVDDDRIVLTPSQVFTNITEALERVDMDINTPVSIEQDVVSVGELAAMVRMNMGPELLVTVANSAMAIMLPRYPEELVRRPLGPQFDLRTLQPAITLTDQQHNAAVQILNRRMTGHVELEGTDIADLLDGLGEDDLMHTFVAIFAITGTKFGALQSRQQ